MLRKSMDAQSALVEGMAGSSKISAVMPLKKPTPKICVIAKITAFPFFAKMPTEIICIAKLIAAMKVRKSPKFMLEKPHPFPKVRNARPTMAMAAPKTAEIDDLVLKKTVLIIGTRTTAKPVMKAEFDMLV